MQAFFPSSRRRCFASLALVGLSLAGMTAIGPTAAAQQSFPYIAYVASETADVRSGPDAASYVTARLPAGFAVEVYRHDADGACAIRPPHGSFSLAPAAAIRPLDGRTAEVVGSSVPARVGSVVSTDAAAVQVLLQQGERVELLGPAVGLADWVRISPPAGEFRWISARHLTRTPPAETGGSPFAADMAGWRPQGATEPAATSSVTSASATPAATAPSGAFRPKSLVDTALYVVAGSPAAQQWDPYRQLQYQQPLAPPVKSGPGPQPTDSPTPAPSSPAAPLPEGVGAVSPGFAATAAPPGAAPLPRVRFAGQGDAAAADPRLGELELALSRIVVGPPLEWRFETLRQETAALLAQAQQPELREKLRDLLERIAMFEQVQRRYQVGASAPVAYAPLPPVTTVPAITPTPSGAPAGSPPTSVPPPSDGPAPAPLPDPFVESDPPRGPNADPLGGPTSDSAAVLGRVQSDLGGGAAPAGPPATTARFDAVGTLKPVYSRRRGAPRYALVDDRGAVVSFLSPSSDLNLDSFLGQRIGVNGSRGFIPEFRQSHVTAGRVTPLDGTVRR